MHPIEFFLFTIDEWEIFLFLFIVCCFILYILTLRLSISGLFDPFHLTYTFTIGTKYAVLIYLYIYDLIDLYYFTLFSLYGIVFYLGLVYFSKKDKNLIKTTINFLIPKGAENIAFYFILLLFILVSLYIIYNIGFGLFAEANRFENNKGNGAFVRITDCFGIFIIAYISIMLYKKYEKNGYKSNFISYLSYFGVFLFIIFFTILNGAKAIFLVCILTIIVSISIYKNKKINLGFFKGTILFTIATFFALAGLSLNLIINNYDVHINLVIQEFIHRIVANGNQTYMGLPNNVIEKIETDNIFIRIGMQIFGSGFMSNIVGYDTNNLAVGRQFLIYHAGTDDIVAGGPTSHFDLFAYVYFGPFFSIVFIIFLSYLIGSIKATSNYCNKKSIFYISLVTTIWIRGLSIILEPATGIAYITDIFILFIFINIMTLFFSISISQKKVLNA